MRRACGPLFAVVLVGVIYADQSSPPESTSYQAPVAGSPEILGKPATMRVRPDIERRNAVLAGLAQSREARRIVDAEAAEWAARAAHAQEHAQEAVQRLQERPRVRAEMSPPAMSSGRCGGDLPSCAIMECESGGDARAHNPASSAAGKWQIIDATWASTEAGANSGVSSAADASESVQDAAAKEIYAGGAGRSQWTC